jgi:acetoin utilization deacetylase AcuC-like enzyme
MTLALPIVWSDRHRLHEPGGEVWVGVRTPGTEVPQRADAIRAALREQGATFVDAIEHPRADLLAVHDPALLDFLEHAWDDWAAAGLPADPGQDRVVPYVFAHRELTRDRPAIPTATWARPGYFAYDTMTLVGPGTWEAARAAADAALTAADLVATADVAAAYAATRPPGHHVTSSAYGGSCYLNNSATAAVKLAETVGAPVAVVDIDAHHGNGTQAIFYERGDVLTGSVHVDPGAGWFPHFLGFADERGAGAGANANRNVPLAPGTGDEGWLGAVETLARWAAGNDARALVVALGVDAAEGDPESPLCVTRDGYRAAGRVLGALGLPTVLVQEGGYDLTTIGALVCATLAGVEEGLLRA